MRKTKTHKTPPHKVGAGSEFPSLSDSPITYDKWASQRVAQKSRCDIEQSISCIPLREDPICRACFEGTINE